MEGGEPCCGPDFAGKIQMLAKLAMPWMELEVGKAGIGIECPRTTFR